MFLLNAEVFPWDLAIALAMGGTLCVGFWSIVAIRHVRRWTSRCAVGILGLVSFLGFLILTWGTFVEPHTISVTRERVTFSYPQPLKIAMLADLHAGAYTDAAFIQRVVARTNAERPDLVVLLGDYVEFYDSDLHALEPLKDLQAPMGVYAVLGNHDVGMYRQYINGPFVRHSRADDIAAFLTTLNVHMLRNANAVIPTSRGPVAVAGVDDIWTGHADLAAALKDIPLNAPSILLVHNPDMIQQPASHAAELILAGHTHGGQIRLPFIGPLSQLPTHLGRAYDQGLFHIDDDTTLAITRGIGESGPRARLFAPPEIMVLETEPPNIQN